MSQGGQLGSREWDQIAGAAGVVGGGLVIVLGRRLDFGAWTNPGPGMMPVLLGVFVVGLSAALWIGSIRRTEAAAIAGASPWSSVRWRPVVLTLAVLLAYSVLLDTLGYVIDTFLLLIVLRRVIEPPRWITTVFTAVLVTTVSYGLFVKLLQVQLPRAAWGF
ncbi:MAG: tripartite tricarboxylate transporter TctB family protein [bacterium]